MRQMQHYVIFPNHDNGMRLYQELKKQGISAVISPTPRTVSKCCGISLMIEEKDVEAKIKERMMVIPNIIDPSVPIGRDDSENVEVQKYGEPVVPDFEIPYHTEIMEKFNGIDLDSARRVAGNGF